MMWRIHGGANAAANPLQSGIRYGQAPPGATVAAGPRALKEGILYDVAVFRFDGGTGDFRPVGSATFTP
jgi:hypothetical protein